MISFIWAEDKNGLIGSNGTLPWHLPDDMHFFKQTTTGHPIVAGSRTFASFGRPLPNRENIVISSRDDFPEEVVVFHSIPEFLKVAETRSDEEFFVVGGSRIFAQLVDNVDRLYRTKIEAEFSGDTYMTEIDYSDFSLDKSIPGIVDEKNKYAHTFQILNRKTTSAK
ncbi:dihydrofolate reductase [Lentilactobacillus sp. Marseille-Q4993]|uniref:dihydrofolate reductase n=1 Tax=Lentilactobacillus sp. Marseille-Q4993 TaxID=3039492 RepID=UPI0024BCB613|nr:dihydrofolate reductase [Lentilactobacillus sp. Marseille-Q4993]